MFLVYILKPMEPMIGQDAEKIEESVCEQIDPHLNEMEWNWRREDFGQAFHQNTGPIFPRAGNQSMDTHAQGKSREAIFGGEPPLFCGKWETCKEGRRNMVNERDKLRNK